MSSINYIPEKMDDFFNKRAIGYDEHRKGLDNTNEFYSMVPYGIVSTEDAVKILDLGTGTGLELRGIFEKVPNAQITCIDITNGMLEELKRNYSAYSDQLNIIVGSYLELPFHENEYDYVVSVQTMHHWLEDTKVQLYKKILKAIKSGGSYIEADYIVDEETEKEKLRQYIEIHKSGVLKEDDIYHIDIPFSVRTQKRIFECVGFSEINVIYQKGNGAILVSKR